MDDLLSEFLTETNESLDVVDVELVKFEQEPNNDEILSNIFRLVHTVKGTCGFLGLPRLEALAHAAETLMGKYRDGMAVTDDGVTIILHSIDRIKEILAELEATEAEPEGVDGDLIDKLVVLSEGGTTVEASGAAAAAPEAPVEPAQPERELRPGEVSEEELERAFQEAEGPDDMVPSPAEAAASAEPEPAVVPEAPKVEAPKADAPKADAKSNDGAPKKEGSVAAQSIRVNVDTLENLMTMVSELVLTRNQLMEMVRRLDDSEFKVPLQRLSNVTGELQGAVMETRMQPIGNAWQKLPRIIRDLSKELGKKIDLEMVGADTELDRQVLDLIKDPLTHMVRNSADHGLEGPEERVAVGKPEKGCVTLRAYHEGGHIIIEIEDDGRGLNVERIKQKVASNGLATEAELEKLTEQQICRFIFHPGLSTAAEVTSVSGRGVGMDVVRTNIELIGGSIDLRTAAGKGSTFTIKIPLTLAIVSALIVESANERFAIPQLAVVELVRAKADSEHRIEHINKTPVLRLRNHLLPLVFMDDLLQLERVAPEPVEHEDVDASQEGDVDVVDAANSNPEPVRRTAENEEAFIVVTHVGDQQFGIVVDSVFDTEEIVVKPAASILRDITMFSGNTILGDGSVIMIVDPNGIAQSITSELSEATDETGKAEEGTSGVDGEMSLLVFRAGSEEPKAVPLSLVTRLEEFDIADLEHSNDQSLIQYRGKLMPIINVVENAPLKTEGRQPVLVFTEDDRSIGLAVDEIVDIVTDQLNVELTSDMPGMMGSAIVRGKATEVLDVGHYLTQVFEDWFRKEGPAGVPEAFGKKVLLVDDSSFFRAIVRPMLSMAGYDVTEVTCGADALALREKGDEFDVIISDIEMPGMSGFEFAGAVKSEGAWSGTPLVALSAHGTAEDLNRGRDAGFDDYVAKFDRDGLVQVVNEIVTCKGEAA